MRWVLGALLLTVVGACTPGNIPRLDPTPSPAPSGLVLRVATLGGFLPVEAAATALPTISVYADGRLIIVGPTLTSIPTAAWPNLLQRPITAAGIDRLVTLAVEAGVGSGADLGTPQVFDAGTTVFTLWTVDGPRTSSALALGVSTDSLTRAQRSARAALSGLLATLDGLSDPSQTLDGQLGPAQPYAPTVLAAVARPWADAPPATPVPWPGPDLPGAPLSLGDLGCVTVTGAPLEALLAAARSTTAATAWMSAGTLWAVWFRPLLPDESSCADL